MPLTVDLFQNKRLYDLWGWVGHTGTISEEGHLYSVTRTANGTEKEPEFVVHNDQECKKLHVTPSNKVTTFLDGVYQSSQAVLVVYVRKDVAEQVLMKSTVITISQTKDTFMLGHRC
jgi:hypothetical protein